MHCLRVKNEFIPYILIFDNINKSEIKLILGSKIIKLICTYLNIHVT